ncbi:peroxidase family protein [Patescibacteria group bacterium]|nr:peroxidase family protein [Patescibacteria group bacterium]
MNWGTVDPAIPFNRCKPAAGTGKGTGINKNAINSETHWLDGSVVYGSDPVLAAQLWNPTTGEMHIEKAVDSTNAGGYVFFFFSGFFGFFILIFLQ